MTTEEIFASYHTWLQTPDGKFCLESSCFDKDFRLFLDGPEKSQEHRKRIIEQAFTAGLRAGLELRVGCINLDTLAS